MAVIEHWIKLCRNEPIVKITSQIIRAVFLDLLPKKYFCNCFRIAVAFTLMKKVLITFLMPYLGNKICYVAKLIPCVFPLHVIGKPLYTRNDCLCFIFFYCFSPWPTAASWSGLFYLRLGFASKTLLLS